MPRKESTLPGFGMYHYDFVVDVHRTVFTQFFGKFWRKMKYDTITSRHIHGREDAKCRGR